ncbi:MAG: hypothetical protein M1822_005561 [Bathelium mastoideum]|nr:MAG: hypothetical protein M1822_005561 [Bathelium mastoideum]
MADWRVTGVVEDSEEEEDIGNLDPQIKIHRDEEASEETPVTGHNVSLHSNREIKRNGYSDTYHEAGSPLHTPTSGSQDDIIQDAPPSLFLSQARQLGSQLLQTEKTTCSIGLQGPCLDRSEASSPLSDVPSILEDPTPLIPNPSIRQEELAGLYQDSETSVMRQVRHVQAQREELRQYIDVDGLSDLQVAVELSSRRKFRKRNPIQLHPYLLEGERYRNTMKASGVRPVQVGNHTAENELLGQRNDSSQDTAFHSEQNNSSPLPLQLPLGPQNFGESNAYLGRDLTPPRHNENIHHIFHSDDDLPNVNTILSRRTQCPARYSDKRRKLSHISIPSQATDHQRLADSARPFLPSPPTSSQSTRTNVSKPMASGFRIPVGFEDLSVTTRTKLSDLGQIVTETSGSTAEQVPRVGSSKGSSSSLRRSRQIVISSESSSSESEPSTNDSGELQRLQKRIKGVLPASWLKLDEKSRLAREVKIGTTNRRGPLSHGRVEHQRGVAQRRDKGKRRGSSAQKGVSSMQSPRQVMNDGNQFTDDPAAETTPTRLERLNEIDDVLHSIVSDDSNPSDMESSWLDPMLQNVTRTHKTSVERSGQRQNRVRRSFGSLEKWQISKRASFKATANAVSKQTMVRKQGRKISRKRNSDQEASPLLSIVDFCPSDRRRSQLPQFLRVAARQIHKRGDRGRQSAGGKYIKLHTLKDTADANELLSAWRAGSIAPDPQNGPSILAQSRRPLRERQGNQQSETVPVDGELQENAIAPTDTEVNTTISKMISLPRQTTLTSFKSRKVTVPNESKPQQLISQKQQRFRFLHQTSNHHTVGRTAQLETLEEDFDVAHPDIAFRRKLSRLDHSSSRLGITDQTVHQQPLPATKKARKQVPARIDVDTKSYRQPVEPLPIDDAIAMAPGSVCDADKQVMQGFKYNGTRYATDFDVYPLQFGTFFHQSTFIGSGAFSESLTVRRRNLDEPTVSSTVFFNEHQWMWSRWDSQVYSQLEVILNTRPEGGSQASPPSEGSLSQRLQTLESITRWLSRSLFFSDPIDRNSFLPKMLNLLDVLRNDIVASASSCCQERLFSNTNDGSLARSLAQMVILANQVLQISKHSSVEENLQVDLEAFLIGSCSSLLSILLSKGISSLRDFQERNRIHTVREVGIRQNDVAVHCVVILWHTLQTALSNRSKFWELVNTHYMSRLRQSNDAQVFDVIWYDIFTLLPFLELDERGLLQARARFQTSIEDWSLVKAIVTRICAPHKEGVRIAGASVNDYFRATLIRCYNLIRKWGWRKCEPILGVFFDFFAQNGLNLLPNERSFGSPPFLEQLDQEPDLSLSPGESSFHIFLKVLALGLLGLRSLYPEKKMRSAVWRYIPNHGRTHRKEDTLQQQHLDALRNHHDLLCTLHWAAPSSCRPRLDLIRTLVDHAQSHKEACRLNVRSWTNLVRFQASSSELTSTLEPFAIWHRDIIRANLDQYQLARKEAEAEYQRASSSGEGIISRTFLESTVAKNQRQVVTIIRDALRSMNSAIAVAKNLDIVNTLVQQSSILDLLAAISFESADRQLIPIISDCLDVVSMYINRHNNDRTFDAAHQSEESQEYGDWSGFESVELEGSTGQESSLMFVSRPLEHLVSNAFGAEKSPEDATLVKIIDVWVQLINHLVRQGWKDWSTYLGPYGPWHVMRDTEQKQRHTPYFVARIIESCPSSLVQNNIVVKISWLETLVERESKLRYQNRLTAAQLNINRNDPLMYNMPFVARADGQYDITTAHFRERRLSIIATFLSNIRKAFEDTRCLTAGRDDAQSDYITLLNKMQAAMKRSYQELQGRSDNQTSDVFSDPPKAQATTGAYVAFVQDVVSLLQQYTSEIAPVDRFFTDSAAFPLPNEDPTYVTGRLRSYSLRLRTADSRILKQLATFILTTSERAAVDGQQMYLMSQLRTAVEDMYECSAQVQTLRRVLLLGVFPAFLEHAFDGAAAALLVRPILQASAMTFEDLMTRFSVFERASADIVLELCTWFLYFLRSSIQKGLQQSGCLADPHALRIFALMYKTAIAVMPLVDYLHRATDAALNAYNCAASLVEVGQWTIASLSGCVQDGTLPPPVDLGPGTSMDVLKDLRAFCSLELCKVLEKGWAWHHGMLWCGLRGSTKQEIAVEIGSVGHERAGLMESIEALPIAIRKLPGSNGGARPWSLPKTAVVYL